MGEDFDVSSVRLKDAAGRITDAVKEVDGWDLEPIARTGEYCGDAAVASAVNDFCSAWDASVRAMRRDADTTSGFLVKAADTYTGVDGGSEQWFTTMESVLATGEVR